MKKFIVLLFAAFALFGCSYNGTEGTGYGKTGKRVEVGMATYEIIELTFDEETHEYVKYGEGYGGSVSHWAGCKYCRRKEKQQHTQVDTVVYMIKEKDYNDIF